MTDTTIRAEQIRIPSTPSVIDQLRGKVHKPEDIDRATRELNIPARLFNVHLATTVDLTAVGLGRAVHIPVQISNSDGGRKSLYYLKVDEEVLAGMFVHQLGIVLRYVRRTSGRANRAESGDTYTERLASLDGTTLVETAGQLEIVDIEKGHGRFKPSTEGLQAATVRNREWWFWSCIYFWEED